VGCVCCVVVGCVFLGVGRQSGGGGGVCMFLSGWAEIFVCVYECVRAFKY